MTKGDIQKEQTQDDNAEIQTPNTKPRKKTFFFITLVVGAVLFFVVFYFIGDNKFAADKQITAFKEAVSNNQINEVQDMLTSSNEEFEITEKNTAALITYLNANQDLDELTSKLQVQAENIEDKNNNIYASIDIVKDGKAWLLFHQYRFEVTPAYLHPMANNEMIEYRINDEKADDILDYTDKGYGPLMPGSYNVTALFDNSFVTDEQSAEVELYETTVEETVHSFDFPVAEIIVNSSYDDYHLYVNGERTDIIVIEGEQNIGEFPNDNSISLSIGKEFPWGEVMSLEETISEENVVEFQVEHALTKEARQELMEKMNSVFANYQEALTERDASLLEEGITENIKEKLVDRIAEIEKEYPNYEGKLVETIYDPDYLSNPEFDDELEAYKITMRTHQVFHEPNVNLGWLYRDEDKDEFTRTNELTVLFNEETSEWVLDSYKTLYYIIPESRKVIFDLR